MNVCAVERKRFYCGILSGSGCSKSLRLIAMPGFFLSALVRLLFSPMKYIGVFSSDRFMSLYFCRMSVYSIVTDFNAYRTSAVQ